VTRMKIQRKKYKKLRLAYLIQTAYRGMVARKQGKELIHEERK